MRTVEEIEAQAKDLQEWADRLLPVLVEETARHGDGVAGLKRYRASLDESVELLNGRLQGCLDVAGGYHNPTDTYAALRNAEKQLVDIRGVAMRAEIIDGILAKLDD